MLSNIVWHLFYAHKLNAKFEALCSSVTSVDYHRTARRYGYKTELFDVRQFLCFPWEIF
jgi:hypothetical protein